MPEIISQCKEDLTQSKPVFQKFSLMNSKIGLI